jgi:hypothetical protein
VPKKKAKKELDKALLSRIEKEMAEPHIAKSAREREVSQDALPAPREATDAQPRDIAPSLPGATAQGGRH